MNRGLVPAVKRIAFWLVVVGLIGCLTGCLSVLLDADYVGPQPLPEQIRQLYHYKKVVPEIKQTVLSLESGYRLRRVEFSPEHSILPFEHHIQMDYYDIHGDQLSASDYSAADFRWRQWNILGLCPFFRPQWLCGGVVGP